MKKYLKKCRSDCARTTGPDLVVLTLLHQPLLPEQSFKGLLLAHFKVTSRSTNSRCCFVTLGCGCCFVILGCGPQVPDQHITLSKWRRRDVDYSMPTIAHGGATGPPTCGATGFPTVAGSAGSGLFSFVRAPSASTSGLVGFCSQPCNVRYFAPHIRL